MELGKRYINSVKNEAHVIHYSNYLPNAGRKVEDTKYKGL
jgi:hypothetical protein